MTTAQQAEMMMGEAGPNLAKYSTMSFEAMTTDLRKPEVVARFNACIRPFLANDMLTFTANRKLLPLYMMAIAPEKTFDAPLLPVERELMDLSHDVLTQLEEFLVLPDGQQPQPEALADFQEDLREYHTKFNAWLIVDRQRLQTRIQGGLLLLCNQWTTVAPDVRIVLLSHVQRLLDKHLAICGLAATTLCTAALRNAFPHIEELQTIVAVAAVAPGQAAVPAVAALPAPEAPGQ